MSALMQQLRRRASSNYARDITYFLAPYINSYKRFQAGTFAPTKAIWSRDNRTAGFRLCGEGTKGDPHRVPHRRRRPQPLSRLRGADRRRASPGIEEKLELEPPFVGRRLCRQGAARSARRRCARRPSCCASRRCCARRFGDEVVEHYVHTARWEQFEYDRRVTDWELKRGFERY